jgi:hypothetical protein
MVGVNALTIASLAMAELAVMVRYVDRCWSTLREWLR